MHFKISDRFGIRGIDGKTFSLKEKDYGMNLNYLGKAQ
jgi:hypothetical protein